MMTFSEQTLAGDDRTLYTVLADSPRRYALHVLHDAESPLALADSIPRLADMDLVEFDADRNTVTVAESTESPRGATGEA